MSIYTFAFTFILIFNKCFYITSEPRDSDEDPMKIFLLAKKFRG